MTSGDTTAGGRLIFYIEVDSTNDFDCFAFRKGMPIYVDGMTGIYGSDNTNVDFYPDTWLANLSDVDANQTAAASVNMNGWFVVINEAPATPTTSTYDAIFSDGDTTAVIYQTVEVKMLNKFYPASDSTLYRIGSSGTPSTAYMLSLIHI